jgi:predicted NAD-dependent protein-ADP-ribosyltransferase YbiA (DUF1768 family)
MCGCVLVFFEKSADTRPGFGTGERHCSLCNYDELSKIADWRVCLSKKYKSSFVDDNGRDWYSYENFYQCNKFFIIHEIPYEECYKLFAYLTPDEASCLSYSESTYPDVIELGLKYKFRNNRKLQNILLKTGTASLVHLRDPNIGPNLEKLRLFFRANNDVSSHSNSS